LFNDMDKKLRCLIIDDEKPAHLVLAAHIGATENLFYKASAYSAKEAIRLVADQEFDIIFLDIEMPLINGLELIALFEKRYAIVLVTAYNDFAYEAYQLHVVDYIQKPVSFSRFLQAADKAALQCAGSVKKSSIATSLMFRKDNSNIEILFANLSHIESIGNYLKLHLINESYPCVIYETLKSIGQRLPHQNFVQAHKSFIVNLSYVASKAKGELIMNNGVHVPVGRKYEILLQQVL
jgi:two-component system, LytTR family, response regulator